MLWITRTIGALVLADFGPATRRRRLAEEGAAKAARDEAAATA